MKSKFILGPEPFRTCKIIEAATVNILEEKINEAFKEGYSLDGDTKFLHGSRGSTKYFQMMIRNA